MSYKMRTVPDTRWHEVIFVHKCHRTVPRKCIDAAPKNGKIDAKSAWRGVTPIVLTPGLRPGLIIFRPFRAMRNC